MTLTFKAVKAAVTDAINPAFFDFVAQMAHIHTMGFYGLVLAIFLGWRGLLIWTACDLAYATFHEFYWDPRHEDAATRGSDIRDFFCLLLGAGMAWMVYGIAHHFGRIKL